MAWENHSGSPIGIVDLIFWPSLLDFYHSPIFPNSKVQTWPRLHCFVTAKRSGMIHKLSSTL